MRSIVWLFGAAGVLLLLANARWLLSPPPPPPRFRTATADTSGYAADVAARSHAAAAEAEAEQAQLAWRSSRGAGAVASGGADADDMLATVATAEFGAEAGDEASSAPPPAIRASQLSGALPRACTPSPDAERRAALRRVGGGSCVAGRALCRAVRCRRP
jgi:hypothetical protein